MVCEHGDGEESSYCDGRPRIQARKTAEHVAGCTTTRHLYHCQSLLYPVPGGRALTFVPHPTNIPTPTVASAASSVSGTGG